MLLAPLPDRTQIHLVNKDNTVTPMYLSEEAILKSAISEVIISAMQFVTYMTYIDDSNSALVKMIDKKQKKNKRDDMITSPIHVIRGTDEIEEMKLNKKMALNTTLRQDHWRSFWTDRFEKGESGDPIEFKLDTPRWLYRSV